MGGSTVNTYRPAPAHQRVYRRLFKHYRTLHEAFGKTSPLLMKNLRCPSRLDPPNDLGE